VLALNLLSQLDHVLALVVVRSKRSVAAEQLLVARPDAVRQMIHLRAGVVVVVLALDLPASLGQHPRQAVADGRVAGVSHVQRPGRIGTDEFDLHPPPSPEWHRPVARAFADDRVDLLAQPIVAEREVDKAWLGSLETGQERWWIARQHGRNGAGDIHRVSPAGPDDAARLQGEVRRVVAQLWPRGSVDDNFWHLDQRQQARLLCARDRVLDKQNEALAHHRGFGRGHPREIPLRQCRPGAACHPGW
jgi:hypothetical protein